MNIGWIKNKNKNNNNRDKIHPLVRIKASRRMKIRSRPLSPRSRPAKGERKKKKGTKRLIPSEGEKLLANIIETRPVSTNSAKSSYRIPGLTRGSP